MPSQTCWEFAAVHGRLLRRRPLAEHELLPVVERLDVAGWVLTSDDEWDAVENVFAEPPDRGFEPNALLDGPGEQSGLDARVDWAKAAIQETAGFIRTEAGSAREELPWARPGSWDYEYEFGRLDVIRRALDTLRALQREVSAREFMDRRLADFTDD